MYSPSSILTFLQCPFRYYLSKNYKVKLENEEVIIGKIVHKIIEEYYKNLNVKNEFEIEMKIKNIMIKNIKSHTDLEYKVSNLIRNFIKFEKERFKKNEYPELIEKYLEYGDICGVIDYYSNGIIIDWKTGKYTMNENNIIQGNIYRFLLESNGYKVDKIIFIYLDKYKKIEIKKYPNEYILKKIRFIKEMEKSNNYPKKKSYLCNKCEFKFYCDFNEINFDSLKW